jgi:hypothetical protein
MRAFLVAVSIALIIAGCAPKTLQVADAWARPGQAGGNSAIYLVINNPLANADTLLSASTAVAETVELHISKMEDGMMVMEQQENVPIAAKSKVTFEPGGLHVMLIGLKNDLKAGDSFQATLRFEQAGDLSVDVTVKEP